MFELETLNEDSIPDALALADRYRLLSVELLDAAPHPPRRQKST